MTTVEISKKQLPPLVQHESLDDPRFINELQKTNWIDKYRFNNETLDEFYWRIANSCASVEKTKDLRKLWAKQYYDILNDWQFTSGGRISANIGTGLKSKSLDNCVINTPVKNATITYEKVTDNGVVVRSKMETPDDPDNLSNIMLTLLEQTKSLASDQGYGHNFSWLRPRGSLIEGISLEHPGAVTYMDMWDATSKVVVNGNTDGYVDTLKNYLTNKEEEYWKKEKRKARSPRKGAQLFALNIDHPDIEEYIKCKRQSGRLTKSNLSVTISDKFMNAVLNDELWELKFKNIVYKRIKAKDLYDLIMESTWKYNDPGVIFIDNMNRYNPIIYIAKDSAANACSEIPGCSKTATVCLLGSINLTKFVHIKNGQPYFDWKNYRKTIRVAVRLLDSVNDLEKSPLPIYQWAVDNKRQFGMGVNGLGSMLAMMNIKYGNNQECLTFVEKIAKTRFEECWDASADLAKEKGPFPLFDKKLFLNTKFFKEKLAAFPELQKKISKYGVRNAKTTTCPPLGNSSIICGNISNGIEPIFCDKYERIYVLNKWPEGLNKDNVTTLFKQVKEGKDIIWKGNYKDRSYIYEPHNRGLCGIEILEDYSLYWAKTNNHTLNNLIISSDLLPEDHVAVMSIFQKWTEQSLSKTMSVPKNFSLKKMKSYYMDAWKAGLIGVTTYREGTMASVLSRIEEKPREIIKQDVKLPETFVNGDMKIVKFDDTKCYIHFSYLPEDHEQMFPIVMWVKSNAKKQSILCNRACRNLRDIALAKGIRKKIVETAFEKSEDDFQHDKVARLVSLNLRHNIPIIDIIEAIENVDGYAMYTLLWGIVQFLSEHIKDDMVIDMECPSCGEHYIEMSGGCKTCKCGWSACSG